MTGTIRMLVYRRPYGTFAHEFLMCSRSALALPGKTPIEKIGSTGDGYEMLQWPRTLLGGGLRRVCRV
jgi:hypothetical protein